MTETHTFGPNRGGMSAPQTAIPELNQGGRFPAFVGLAKATGGLYVEDDNGMTVPDALRKADMDFTVEAIGNPTVTVMDEFGVSQVTGKQFRATVATWRNPDGSPRKREWLGTVKGRYSVCQNMEAAGFGQAVLEESGANVVALGGYGEPFGTKMFMAFKLPEGITVAGEDPHDLYLCLGTSHDGGGGLWGVLAPIRLSCTNQVAATFGSASNRFTIRHTGEMSVKIQEVQRALDLAGTWTDRFGRWSEEALTVKLSPRVLETYLEKSLMPTPRGVKTDRADESWAARRKDIVRLFTDSPTCEFGKGTAYGAYLAISEYADHFRPVRGGQVRQYARLIDGDEGERMKIRAASELLKV